MPLQLNTGKTLGADGLTAEFYKHFVGILSPFLADVFNTAFEIKELSLMQRLAIIVLLFKKGEKDEAGNYHPISLTNVDYKFLAYVLTSYLEPHLEMIIHPSQMAYMKGCFIEMNICKVQDAIDYSVCNNKKWVFVFLDFRKAFDSVSHLFLFTLMSSMGFPPEYGAGVLLMYTHTTFMVRNNSLFSETFRLGHGVCQGCPLLCHLFNLVGQVTVYYLQTMGIFTWWCFESDPSSLYANDMALVLEGLDMLPKALELIQYCRWFTGL